MRRSLSWLGAAAFWAGGAVLLMSAHTQSDTAKHFADAPTCAANRVFSTDDCRATVDGILTDLTDSQAKLLVNDRNFTAGVSVYADFTDVDRLPVEVTFYRGVVVHIKGNSLDFDTKASPTGQHSPDVGAALAFILLGATLIPASLTLSAAKRG